MGGDRGKTNLVLLLPFPFRFGMSLREFRARPWGAGEGGRSRPYLCSSPSSATSPSSTATFNLESGPT